MDQTKDNNITNTPQSEEPQRCSHRARARAMRRLRHSHRPAMQCAQTVATTEDWSMQTRAICS